MNDITANAAQNKWQVTQADLDAAARVARVAQEAWPLYAEAKGISDAEKYEFQGVDSDGTAKFVWEVMSMGHYMGDETVYMDLDFLLDKAAAIAAAAEARQERERVERERVEQARQHRLAEQARQAEYREAQERAELVRLTRKYPDTAAEVI